MPDANRPTDDDEMDAAEARARAESDAGERDTEDVRRVEGTVKWYSERKGYGFIARDDMDDIFFHNSDIERTGFKTMEEGRKVEFDLIKADKGPKAVNIVATS
jgi:CspA family cold shock protein